jgi:hypothetical protein
MVCFKNLLSRLPQLVTLGVRPIGILDPWLSTLEPLGTPILAETQYSHRISQMA